MAFVFPDPMWPSDADISGLDGTTDLETGLPYIAKGTGPTSVPSYEIQYNRRQQRLNQIMAPWRQGMVVGEGGLNIGVYPMSFVLGGARRTFLGASGVSVSDDSTSVVYLDENAQLATATVWPTDMTTFVPLASVAAAGGQVVIEDRRSYSAFYIPTLEASAVEDRRTLSVHRASVGNSQSDVEVFEFDPPEDMTLDEVQVYCSAVGGTASVDVKANGSSVLSAPATPSASAVTKPTVASVGITAGESLTVHATTDGTGTISDLAVTLILKAPLAA